MVCMHLSTVSDKTYQQKQKLLYRNILNEIKLRKIFKLLKITAANKMKAFATQVNHYGKEGNIRRRKS